MPIDLKTFNNIYVEGLRAFKSIEQFRLVQALKLVSSPNIRQRQWALKILQSDLGKRSIKLIEDLEKNNYELGQAVSNMSRDASKAISDVKTIANLLDDNGLYASADLADEVAIRIKSIPNITYNQNTSLDNRLITLADYLDNCDPELANALDMVLKVAIPISKKNKEPPSPIKPRNITPLSSRHCPDHRGVQVSRVGENAYQCPIDGRIYNYENGYVDYKGYLVPGGSIAAQTPDSSPVGIPMRIYDSRSNTF